MSNQKYNITLLSDALFRLADAAYIAAHDDALTAEQRQLYGTIEEAAIELRLFIIYITKEAQNGEY